MLCFQSHNFKTDLNPLLKQLQKQEDNKKMAETQLGTPHSQKKCYQKYSLGQHETLPKKIMLLLWHIESISILSHAFSRKGLSASRTQG